MTTQWDSLEPSRLRDANPDELENALPMRNCILRFMNKSDVRPRSYRTGRQVVCGVVERCVSPRDIIQDILDLFMPLAAPSSPVVETTPEPTPEPAPQAAPAPVELEDTPAPPVKEEPQPEPSPPLRLPEIVVRSFVPRGHEASNLQNRQVNVTSPVSAVVPSFPALLFEKALVEELQTVRQERDDLRKECSSLRSQNEVFKREVAVSKALEQAKQGKGKAVQPAVDPGVVSISASLPKGCLLTLTIQSSGRSRQAITRARPNA